MRSVTLACLLTLAAALPGVQAAEPVMTGWSCSSCPKPGGWQTDLDVGLAAVGDDAFRFGNITGLDSDGAALLGDVYTEYRDDAARFFILDGYLRGENAVGLFARGGKQGLIELRASYQELPRRMFGDTLTPYRGSDSQQLPDNWIAGPTTGAMQSLSASQRSEPIASDLDALKLGLNYQPASHWDLALDYARRQERGRARWGSSFLFNAIELAAPVDQVTSNLDASLGYTRDRWQLRVAYFGSRFENREQQLSWENAYSVPFGVSLGRAARAPENEAHQVSVTGTWALPARTVLAFSAGGGEMTQDAALLDYSIDPSLNLVPLPRDSASAEVQTRLVNLRVTSSPWRRLSFEGEWRFYDHDNRSRQAGFDYVVTDSVPAAAAVRSTAYDYGRNELKLRAEYRPWRPLAFDLGFSTRELERNQQERDRTTTDRLWLEARARVPGVANLKAVLLSETRDGSDYTELENPSAPQNPLMRKYNLADRDRSGLRLRAGLLAFPQADISAEFALLADDYAHSGVGLTGSRSRRMGVDAAYTGGRLTAYLSWSEEQIRTEQQNSQSFGQPDWSATSSDKFSTAVFGLTRPQLFDTVDLELEYSWSRSRGTIDKNTNGLPSAFPDLAQTRNTLRLGLRYPFREALSFGLDYFFEEVSSSDWALDGAGPATVPTLLSLGAQAWNYRSNVLYASVTLRQ